MLRFPSIASRQRNPAVFLLRCRFYDKQPLDPAITSTILPRSSRSNGSIAVTKRFVSQSHHDIDNIERPSPERRDRGARPLYCQPSPTIAGNTTFTTQSSQSSSKSSKPFTPYEFLGTAAVLPPRAFHLAPCLGAALAMSPLVGNLRRLGQRQPDECLAVKAEISFVAGDNDNGNTTIDRIWSDRLSRIGFLANNLFFQLIRESPLHLVRNKSLPATYLTPGILGCLVAHHHQQASQRVLQEALRRDFGIKSNRIRQTHWTGISLARWMDLVIPSCTHHHDEDPLDSPRGGHLATAMQVYQQTLVSALWLVALWGMAPSPASLQEYYEALERNGIALCRAARNSDTPTTRPGVFAETDFAPPNLQAAMNRLLDYYSATASDSDTENRHMEEEKDAFNAARALELVCAAIVLQQQPHQQLFPPATVPNGYFAFDGGATKADCAEVVVREILTLLLWDDAQGSMDSSRLPSTTSRELRNWLVLQDDDKSSSSSTSSSQNNPQATTFQQQQQQPEEDLGQAWFDLLSDLDHCDYLAKSPNGRPYELAPTSESISKALWHLLVGGGNSSTGQPWTSLHDLASFWNDLQHEKNRNNNEQQEQQQQQHLVVKQDRLQHQSGDGTILEHELISLHLSDNSKAMELRLRCDFHKASGMAAVTHLTKPRQEGLLDPHQVQQLFEICFGQQQHHHHPDPSLVMLCLALQSEYESLLPSQFEEDGNDFSNPLESLLWLATPYGPDRRELRAVEDDDSSSDLEDRTILIQSQGLLKERILHACRVCQSHPRSGAHLLSWILQESPVVVESSSSSLSSGQNKDDDDSFAIERALLSLPTSVLDNDSVLEAIEWNWACRGRILTKAIRWKLQKLSAWQVVSQSNMYELTEVLSLLRSMDRRDWKN